MKQFKTLRAWRRERGWSQREAAVYLHTSQNSYKNWERGTALPRPETLRRVVAKTGIALADLLRERLREPKPALKQKVSSDLGDDQDRLLETRNSSRVSDNVSSDKKRNLIHSPAPLDPDPDPQDDQEPLTAVTVAHD